MYLGYDTVEHIFDRDDCEEIITDLKEIGAQKNVYVEIPYSCKKYLEANGFQIIEEGDICTTVKRVALTTNNSAEEKGFSRIRTNNNIKR